MNVYREYRKKPVVIDAARWDGTVESATPIIDWIVDNGGTARYHEHLMDGDLIVHPDPYILIDTLEGAMSASAGDWVLRGVKGEFYPCKPDIFEATYEEVALGMNEGYPFGKLDPDNMVDQAIVKAWNKGADDAG